MTRWPALLGVVAAATLAGVAVVVALALSTGFARAAERADLPDVIARFDPRAEDDVLDRVRALPGVESAATRAEITRVGLRGGSGSSPRGALQIVGDERRGYAITAGRDVRPGGAQDEVVVERGLADTWGLGPGDTLRVEFAGDLRIVGVALAPDNVAFPLASAPRVFVDRDDLERRFGFEVERVNQVSLWLRPGADLDAVLTQARLTSYGLTGLRFVTRDGVRILLDRAAGVVIALLGAFALVALATAVLLLALGARADVVRRLPVIGIERALGRTRAGVTGRLARRAALAAVPAAVAGVALGAAVSTGPVTRLLRALSMEPPGAAALPWLAVTALGLATIVVLATVRPAYAAAGRPIAGLLRGGDLAATRPPRAGRRRGGDSALVLGVRLAAARRGRALGVVGVLGASVAVVLLMLALADRLVALRDDPTTLGKSYSLVVRGAGPGAVAAVPGVAGAANRFNVEAVDAFELGEPVRVVAVDAPVPSSFEGPPLADGRRARGPREAEVGVALAQVLGLRPGSELALLLPSGAELRLRVAGVVRALDNDGRMAYVPAAALTALVPGLEPEVAVQLDRGADRDAVVAALRATGAEPTIATGAAPRDRRFLGLLAALLRVVAGVTALVCLFALVQSLSVVARERRSTLAVLRSCGAGTGTLVAVLAGAGLALAAAAIAAGAVLQRLVLGPVVARLAAGYADLPLGASAVQTAGVAAGVLGLAGVAAVVVARRTAATPVVPALREP